MLDDVRTQYHPDETFTLWSIVRYLYCTVCTVYEQACCEYPYAPVACGTSNMQCISVCAHTDSAFTAASGIIYVAV